VKAIGSKDNTAKPERGGKRRSPEVPIPSETANEPFFTKQARSYGDCYRWSLADEERRQWMEVRSMVLGALRVFSCGIFVEARGHRWERDGLPEGILIYCTEGNGHYRQEDREYEVQPGDLLYCPPRTHHGYWADAEHPWTIHWMHLSGDLLPRYESLLGLIERGPVRHIGLHDDIIAGFTRLVTHPPLSSADASQWFCVQANAVTILGHIAALPHNISDIAAAYVPIQKAIALMRASLDQPFDLPRFAHEAGYGIRHFTRQFRRVAGLPPGDWFIQQKMRRARELLTLPNIRVKGVAARLGYTDPLYFSRVFKRIVGLPPEAYHWKVARMHGLDDHPESHSSD
jgi:AraC-like DNA-binding protein/quercetin dioxygenase-like cupin family protein